MFCLCDFQSLYFTVTIQSVVKSPKKYSKRHIHLLEIVNLHKILFILLLLWSLFLCLQCSWTEKHSPLLMTYIPTTFPLFRITKVTVFEVIFATFTFIKMGLNPDHDLNTSCVKYILILQMTSISCRLLEKNPRKRMQHV